MKVGKIFLIMLFLLFSATIVMANGASPTGCTADNSGVNIAASTVSAQVGQTITFNVTAGNPTSTDGCDIVGRVMTLILPNGTSIVYGPNNYPNPTPVTFVGSADYVAKKADLVGGVWTATVTWNGSLQNGFNVPSTGGKQATVIYVPVNLAVTKDATTSYDRTYTWTIDKSVIPSTLDLFDWQNGLTNYTVQVTKSAPIDSNFKVNGTITITNPSAFVSAHITNVTDGITGVITPATVICPVTFPYELAAGAELDCTYSATLPNTLATTNTATVTTTGDIDGGSGIASVNFTGVVPQVTNGSINVDDTNGGSWPFSDSGTANYSKTFDCSGAEYVNGYYQYTHPNTATIRGTAQNDSALVTVNCYKPSVAKNATPEEDVGYTWTIDKSVIPTTLNLFDGDTAVVNYTVSVTKTAGSGMYSVSGGITLTNPSSVLSLPVENVIDEVSGGFAATVECGVTFPYSLGPSQTLTCTYNATLPDSSTRTNTVTVTTTGGLVIGTANAPVDFTGVVPKVTNGSINVDDTNGFSWPFSDSGSENYSRSFDCSEVSYTGGHANYTYVNTATIRGTTQSGTASVTVDCYKLAVTKDATTNFTRTYNWQIVKTGKQSSLTLAIGNQSNVSYSVVVSVAGHVDSKWAVGGGINVSNPNPSREADLTQVLDSVSGTTATVNCPSLVVPAGSSLICTYTTPLSDGTARTNTATATMQNKNFAPNGGFINTGTTSYTGTAGVTFGAPTNEVDKCVTVNDNQYGSLGTICTTDSPKTFTYSLTVGPYSICGNYTYNNTASFVTSDTAATGNSSWTVNVNVPCAALGCTYTPGYWKTHSKYGPAAHPDSTWYNLSALGPDTPFFLSNQTWYKVMWTAPKGNAYYQLSFQYTGARLNILSGASAPSAVTAAITKATTLFGTYTPAQIAAMKGNNAIRAEFISLAGILGDYDSGITGPGHCGNEQVT